VTLRLLRPTVADTPRGRSAGFQPTAELLNPIERKGARRDLPLMRDLFYPTLKGTTMSSSLRIHALSALFASSVVAFTGAASAAPIGEPRALIKAVPGITQPVQWRGGGWGWGAPVAGGIIAGAIIGSALAAPYGPGYYGPAYYPPPVAYGPPPGDAIAYCMQRFRSYDPNSGTYLGFDGSRHPCP
jgi:hypothetical protein